ncbi:protein FAM117A isoform X2 [Octodon degus]|uniref:Protein FAM117A isoform X2 n=1 Tax=Octodon degus TaxID=10160 RepID=A0A6P6EP10_OCTDE|nr:protein FAM117A isoform X2 [Octodon degus]
MAGAATGGRGGGAWGPGRGGAGGLRRGCSPPAPSGSPRAGLQPLRATVPFQLQQPSQRRDGGGRAASVPCSVASEKSACRPQPPQVRRTFSLDTILSSYLLGQWPREADGAFTCCTNDKATQTPLSWQEPEGERATSCTHKRSASWGSTDHRKEVTKLKQQLQRTKLSRSGKEKERGSPLQGDHALRGALRASPPSFPMGSPFLRLSPCLHRSLEGLNQELEEVFVKEQGEEELLRILEVPDGHRAPAPPQNGSCDHPLLLLEPGNPAGSPSMLLASPQPSGRASHEDHRGAIEELASVPNDKAFSPGHPASLEDGSPSPVLAFAASPQPNHSYVFKREPPEGCERVRVFEEATASSFSQLSHWTALTTDSDSCHALLLPALCAVGHLDLPGKGLCGSGPCWLCSRSEWRLASCPVPVPHRAALCQATSCCYGDPDPAQRWHVAWCCLPRLLTLPDFCPSHNSLFLGGGLDY